MPSLYPHEERKIGRGAAESGPVGFLLPCLRGRIGERKPIPPYSAIVYKEGDEVRADDWKGRKITSGKAGVDDTNVIQSAIDELSYGGVVFIKRGLYIITKTIEIKNTHITFIGENRRASDEWGTKLKLADNANCDMIHVRGIKFYCERMEFDGNESNQTVSDLRIIYDTSGLASDLTLRNVYCWNVAGTFLESTGSHGWLDGCVFEHADLIAYIKNARLWRFTGNLFYVSGAGLKIEGSAEAHANHFIVGNSFYYCSSYGIKIVNSFGNNIVGNIFRKVGNGIELENADYNLISGNLIHAAQKGINQYNSNENSIVGNTFKEIDGNAIYIENSAKNVINNNFIIDNKATGIYLNGASYNMIYSNHLINIGSSENDKFWGIALYHTADIYSTHNVVENNIIQSFISNKLAYGIGEKDSLDDYNIIKNNKISEVTKRAIKREGANTIIRENIGWATENSGTATFNGDGTTTQFSIAHGLVSEPSKVQVTPMTEDAAGDFYVTKDTTNIYVNYLSAPPSGSNNVKLSWYAEV